MMLGLRKNNYGSNRDCQKKGDGNNGRGCN